MQTLEVTVPANVADVICEAARSHGTSISDWLMRIVADAMTPDEQRQYRRAWAEAALASFEDDNGPITDDDLKTAERAWQD